MFNTFLDLLQTSPLNFCCIGSPPESPRLTPRVVITRSPSPETSAAAPATSSVPSTRQHLDPRTRGPFPVTVERLEDVVEDVVIAPGVAEAQRAVVVASPPTTAKGRSVSENNTTATTGRRMSGIGWHGRHASSDSKMTKPKTPKTPKRKHARGQSAASSRPPITPVRLNGHSRQISNASITSNGSVLGEEWVPLVSSTWFLMLIRDLQDETWLSKCHLAPGAGRSGHSICAVVCVGFFCPSVGEGGSGGLMGQSVARSSAWENIAIC